jgi:hypothetical protein
MSRSRFITTALAAVLLALPSLADDVTNTPKYINVPGTDTKIKIYGFVQVYASEYLNVSEFNNGGLYDNYSSGTSMQSPKNQLNMTARTSRFGFATITPSSTFGDVTTKVELDFANSSGKGTYDQAVPRIRQAVINANNWTVGFTWTNWIDLDAGVETVDWAGSPASAPYDTPRYTQIKYKMPFTKQMDLTVSLEENVNDNPMGLNSYANGSPYTGTIIGNKVTGAMADTKYPTVVAAFTYADSWGHIGVRGMEQYWGAYQPNVAAAGAVPAIASNSCSTWAGAAQLSGDVKFGKDDLVFTVYTGQGLGSYGTDNGFDFVANPIGGQIKTTTSTGWTAGYTHVWTPSLRSNFIASGLIYTKDASAAMAAELGGSAAAQATAQAGDYKNAQYYAVNTFYKFSKSLELGVEFFNAAVQYQGNVVSDINGNMTNKMHANTIDATLTATF